MMMVACASLLAAQGVLAEKLTNASVIQLVNSGAVTEDVIVSTVANAAEVEFDMSVNGVIALSTAKVSPKVIEAMQKRANPAAAEQPAPAAQAVAAAVATDAAVPQFAASDVYLVEDGVARKLLFSSAHREISGRSAWTVRTSFNLIVPGQRASLRIKTASPEFLVSLPANQNTDNVITLVSFGVRRHRYVACVGNATLVLSGGIRGLVPGNRIVGISVTKAADQSNAAAGQVIYSVKPTAPLISTNRKTKAEFGEYGLNVGNESQFIDFGVDE